MFFPRPAFRRWWPLVGGALVALSTAGCAFDDAGAQANLRCERDFDCVIGTCIARRCVAEPDGPVPTDDAGTSDISIDPGPDASQGGCPDGEIEACGTCVPASELPGQPCEGACGTWQCRTGGSGVACVVASPNACGGCSRLPAVRGAACGGTCATWQCQGTDTLVCTESPRNACGGCGELTGTPGAGCGACGGTLACDGLDALECRGGATNACGGCGTPAGAVLDRVCACGAADTPDPALWRCSGTDVVCEDRPDLRFLGDRDDTDTGPATEATDVLQVSGDVDLHYLRGRDILGTDPLQPSAQVSARVPLELCATWEYTSSGPLRDPICIDGTASTFDGATWCCATTGGIFDSGVTLGNPRGNAGRLDVTDGADNDGGVLTLRVRARDADETCVTYDLSVTL